MINTVILFKRGSVNDVFCITRTSIIFGGWRLVLTTLSFVFFVLQNATTGAVGKGFSLGETELIFWSTGKTAKTIGPVGR